MMGPNAFAIENALMNKDREFFANNNICADENPVALARIINNDPDFLNWVRVSEHCINNSIKNISMSRTSVLSTLNKINDMPNFNLEKIDVDILCDLSQYFSKDVHDRHWEVTMMERLLSRLNDTNIAVYFSNLILLYDDYPESLASLCEVISDVIYKNENSVYRFEQCLHTAVQMIKHGLRPNFIESIKQLTLSFTNIPPKIQKLIQTILVF